MTCPLCGHRFEAEETHCAPGCPLRRSCGLRCCPHCHYQFVGESSTLRFLKRLFRARPRPAGGEA